MDAFYYCRMILAHLLTGFGPDFVDFYCLCLIMILVLELLRMYFLVSFEFPKVMLTQSINMNRVPDIHCIQYVFNCQIIFKTKIFINCFSVNV